MSKKLLKKLSSKKQLYETKLFSGIIELQTFLEKISLEYNTTFISKYPKLKPTKTIKFSSYNTEYNNTEEIDHLASSMEVKDSEYRRFGYFVIFRMNQLVIIVAFPL